MTLGNYSRDPLTLAADAVDKRYFAVRMQQGVPVLDADWNILDDIRRLEHEAVGRFVLGDGVPAGSDAFRIVALENGGVNTIVLTSAAVSGPSSVAVDLTLSTAAAALGFTSRNAFAQRTGDSPARLTGFRAGPFLLAAGSTLVVSADGQPAETVTFAASDFANIAAATAAEVVAAITAQITRAVASAGTGNDFIIRGPNPATGAPGRIFVGGQLVLNEADVTCTAQPLYGNTALATSWGVAPVAPVPASAARIVIFLDVWAREVNSAEDPAMLDSRIGLETAIRLKREWVVRTATEVDFVATAAPPGHTYYPLAFVTRPVAEAAVRAAMLTDVRETDLALRREVAFFGPDGTLLVPAEMFRNVLLLTRNNVRDFIAFLTETFIPPGTAYFAGEVGGISALHAVAGLAEQGLTVADARSMDTRGAFALLGQLRSAEQRVVDVWRTAVLPLERVAGVRAYENAFLTMINAIERLLTGPAPVGLTPLATALNAGDLLNAVRAQERIAAEFGNPANQSTGSLLLTYLGSPAPTILRNVPFDMAFELSGTCTPEDDIDVQVFIDPAWQVTLRNKNGTTPLALRFGPGSDTEEFIVTVRPPDVTVAETTFSLLVSARSNPGGLAHMTGDTTLRIGDPPPASGEDYAITLLSTNVPQVGGVYQVPVSFASADLTFAIHNHTSTVVQVDLEYTPTAAAGWTIVPPLGWPATGTNVAIPATGSVNRDFQFGPPAVPGASLTVTLRAREAGTVNLLAEMQLTLTTVAG